MAYKVSAISLDSVRAFKSRIINVGIEIEGGWTRLPPGARIVRDGSVHLPEVGEDLVAIGEFPSHPMSPSDVDMWMRAFYPQYVNSTCGLHVHMSFKHALQYQRLMSEEYPATIVEYMTRWAIEEALPMTHPLWARLKGESLYCQHIFNADQQVLNQDKDYNQQRKGHRYTVINYCWARYHTLECRLLPMMSTVEQSIRAVQEVMDITNKFLVVTARREAKASQWSTFSDTCDTEEVQLSL